ncbi:MULTISPECIES: hypothetical protein [Streptacidiphilus]|uniref:Nif11 domain-containing protein n=2 Tax=Streptacidiphilus TaxID=228398 RepID=A0ABV6UJX4_9ACTN|nr:hypothetical protein [Streptacidiphilus jeojiense]
MSQTDFLRFLSEVGDDPQRLARYDRYSLAQLIFHSGNEGYSFNVPDIESVVGQLEANVIIKKDNEAFDGSSSLWRSMWGRRHLDYVVRHLISRHTAEELAQLATPGAGEAK